MITLQEASKIHHLSRNAILELAEQYQITITGSGTDCRIDDVGLQDVIQLNVRINDCKGDLRRILQTLEEEIEIRKEEMDETLLRLDDLIDFYKSIERISPVFKFIMNEAILLLPEGIIRDVFIDVCHSKQLSEVAQKYGLSLAKTCHFYYAAIKFIENRQGFLAKYIGLDAEMELEIIDLKRKNRIASDYSNLLSLDLVSDLGLSTRAFNCLRSLGLRTVEELLRFVKTGGFDKLTDTRNLGDKTLTEIKEALIEHQIIDKDEYSDLFRYV